ncbi:MAG: flavodoxin [Lachnospiraceae bacterium]|nr:flavodoxin [Lachnospiraceae bacterium]
MNNNGIILYRSKYGAAKKYADWLKEATGFECMETKKADIQKVKEFDVIIFGGGIYASGIGGISFLKKNVQILKNKKIILFCVGASPFEEGAFQEICRHNLTEGLEKFPCFYCRGMWDEEAMSLKDRTLCKMLQKMIKKQDPSTYEPWQKALVNAAGQKCDWTDPKYLEPLLAYMRRENLIAVDI